MLRIRQCLQNDRTKQRKSLFDIQCYCLREDQNLKELLFRLNLRGTHTLDLPHFINRYFICFCLLLWNSNSSYHTCRSVLPYCNAMFYFVNETNPCTLESSFTIVLMLTCSAKFFSNKNLSGYVLFSFHTSCGSKAPS